MPEIPASRSSSATSSRRSLWARLERHARLDEATDGDRRRPLAEPGDDDLVRVRVERGDHAAQIDTERHLHRDLCASRRSLRIVELRTVSETSFSFGITSLSASGVRTHV